MKEKNSKRLIELRSLLSESLSRLESLKSFEWDLYNNSKTQRKYSNLKYDLYDTVLYKKDVLLKQVFLYEEAIRKIIESERGEQKDLFNEISYVSETQLRNLRKTSRYD